MFTKNPDDQSDNGGPVAQGTPPGEAAAPIIPSRAEGARPAIVRRAREYSGTPADDRSVGSYGDSKKLIVGREIALNGEISACEKLVVEGRVEANMKDCREIEIAEGGTFKGEAEIEIAEISGSFEGNITARNLLIIRSTGQVTGKVCARQLEVERGGEISGEIEIIPEAD
ncbi:MAG: polymer-forming cytoskeletal protein [Alphaproteobacteria bacterium]|nr:polymer-forming cytoskeletal protein [Alphaproteobacteria bacterium]